MTKPEVIRQTRAKATKSATKSATKGATKSDPLAPNGTAVRAAAVTKPGPAASPVSRIPTEAGHAVTSAVKPKLVRDSFTIPKAEYAVLESLKLRAAKLARPSKKSEVLRAGISALSAMSDKALVAALNAVPSLKTGRPSGAPTVANPRPAIKR